MTCTALQI